MIREQFIIQSAPDRQIATRTVSFLLKAKYGTFIDYQWLVDVDVYPVDDGAKIGAAQCNQTICCKMDNRTGEMQELVSAAVTKGTIQLLPNGQLIVLMADHQTIGGYPCIGHVISADIPSLAQSDNGQALAFESVSIAEAETLRLHQEQHLQQLQYSCTFRMQEYFSL